FECSEFCTQLTAFKAEASHKGDNTSGKVAILLKPNSLQSEDSTQSTDEMLWESSQISDQIIDQILQIPFLCVVRSYRLKVSLQIVPPFRQHNTTRRCSIKRFFFDQPQND